jgi:hypothetical protein
MSGPTSHRKGYGPKLSVAMGCSAADLSLRSMDDVSKEVTQEMLTDARGLVLTMISAALAAQVDGDEDLFGEVLAELGKVQRVTIRAVLMTQTWTLVNAIMAMAEVAERDPQQYWEEVALKLMAFQMKEGR